VAKGEENCVAVNKSKIAAAGQDASEHFPAGVAIENFGHTAADVEETPGKGLFVTN
jgi:hypothetical protein